MAENERLGGDSGGDVAFERELLASAAADRVGEDAVQAAWARFAVAAGATATLAGAATTRGAPGVKLAAGTRGALGWLSLGALGGGIVTAALIAALAGRGGPVAASNTAVASPSVGTAPATVGTARATAGTAPNVGTAPVTVGTVQATGTAPNVGTAPSVSERAPYGESPAATVLKRRAVHAAERDAPAREPAGRPDTSSSLAAEIALLDDARRASGAGEFDRALALLGRYHREHPHGELRRESDVLRLETLFLRGDRDEATRLARHFLEAFPDDPHVAHVRTLAQ